MKSILGSIKNPQKLRRKDFRLGIEALRFRVQGLGIIEFRV